LRYPNGMNYKVIVTTMGKTLWRFGPMFFVAYHCISLKILQWHGMHMISYTFAPKDVRSIGNITNHGNFHCSTKQRNCQSSSVVSGCEAYEGSFREK
jgi:hypothetical protein